MCVKGAQSMVARAAKGVVVGAGRLGLVPKPGKVKAQAAGNGSAVPDPTLPGQDQDGDGIIGAFDVDDNGNMVIDNADITQVARDSMLVLGC